MFAAARDSSADKQSDATWSAMYSCFADYAETYQGQPTDLLNLAGPTLQRMSVPAGDAMSETAPVYRCDSEGCWADGAGFSWTAIAIRHRCSTPEYGDECPKPGYQR